MFKLNLFYKTDLKIKKYFDFIYYKYRHDIKSKILFTNVMLKTSCSIVTCDICGLGRFIMHNNFFLFSMAQD